ncbi:MAG: hypothetical protein ACYCU3_14205 [Streptosporangiaceae bacterium]
MGKVLQTHRFGAHQVDVLEQFDDEGTSYLVLVDHMIVTDPPLLAPPGFEEVVRIYARSRQSGSGVGDGPGGASGGTAAGTGGRE